MDNNNQSVKDIIGNMPVAVDTHGNPIKFNDNEKTNNSVNFTKSEIHRRHSLSEEDMKELSRHKRHLTEKMADCYEKNDAEMGKKYREKLKKLMDDEEYGEMGALSEYEIDESGEDNEDIKKKERELSKLKDENTALLAKNNELQASLLKLQPQSSPEDTLNQLRNAFKNLVGI